MSEVIVKFCKAMEEVGNVPKRGKYEEGRQSYAFMTADDIAAAVNTALVKAEVMIIPEVTAVQQNEIESRSGTKGYHTVLSMRFTLTDGDGIFTSEWAGESIDYSDKGISKAVTLGRKYFLISLFNIATGENTDPDGENHEITKTDREQITKELGYAENQPSSRAPLSPVKLKEKLVLTANTVKPASEKQLGYVARLMADAIKDPEELKEVKLWLTGTEHLQQADQRIVHAILKWFNVINYKIDPVALDELTAIRVHIQTADGQDTLL